MDWPRHDRRGPFFMALHGKMDVDGSDETD
jgi:hypothetical protein